MIHVSMSRFALMALFGAATAACSSAQEDLHFDTDAPVAVVVAAQEQPRQLRVRLPQAHQQLFSDVFSDRLLFVRPNGARLGVTVDTTKDGLTVENVNAGSLAESAGLQAGDIIHRVGEDRIESVEDVTRALSHFDAGDSVSVTVIRAGEGLVELTGTLPEPAEQDHGPLADGHRNGFLGVELAESDDDNGDGVGIVGTIPNSAAWYAGLNEGDRLLSIDGTAVNSYEELTGAIASKQPGTLVELSYERDGATHATSVRLGHRMPQGPMNMLFTPGQNMRFGMQFPGFELHGAEGMDMFFGDGDHDMFRLHRDMDGPHRFDVRIERDGDGPSVLHFGNSGSMHGLHELLQEFDGHSRRIEVIISDGEGTVTIESDGGTRTYDLEDGTWVSSDDNDLHEEDDEDGPEPRED